MYVNEGELSKLFKHTSITYHNFVSKYGILKNIFFFLLAKMIQLNTIIYRLSDEIWPTKAIPKKLNTKPTNKLTYLVNGNLQLV